MIRFCTDRVSQVCEESSNRVSVLTTEGQFVTSFGEAQASAAAACVSQSKVAAAKAPSKVSETSAFWQWLWPFSSKAPDNGKGKASDSADSVTQSKHSASTVEQRILNRPHSLFVST